MKPKARILTSFLRGVRILEYIASEPEGARLAEIAKYANLPASNATLYLNTLVTAGAVLRDPIDKRYFISPSYVERFRQADRGLVHRLLDVAEGPMRGLHEKYNENVLIGFQRNHRIIFLKHIATHHLMRINIEPEPEYPLHVTAAGRAILAFLPERDIQAYMKTAVLEKLTRKTVTSRKDLFALFEKVRTEGYAFNPGEFEDGVMALAAPIRLDGRPLACLDIQFPTLRHTLTEAEAAAPDVIQAARKIEALLKKEIES